MRSYRVELNDRSERDLRRLPRDLRDRVRRALCDLEHDPRPQGYGPVRSCPGLYRVRVGKQRVLYTIDDSERLVRVYEIMPREKDYRSV